MQLSAVSSASSMIDLSQAQIRLSPLERTTSHLSLHMHPPSSQQPDTAASSQLSSQLQLARSSPASQLTGGGSRPKMTRSQSHLSSVRPRGPASDWGEAGGGGGTMDRFLASVERINAETEARLGEDTDPDTSSGAQQPRPGSGGVNLRRGRTISSRWHSMESLYCTVLYCTVLYCTVL